LAHGAAAGIIQWCAARELNRSDAPVVREDAVASDFTFFEQSLRQPRVYRVWRGREREIVRLLAEMDGLDILEETEEETLIRTVNLTDPGTPGGVKPIEERFGIHLPRELHEFYRRWNGGVLVYGTIHFLLGVEGIIETTSGIREAQQVSQELPWHILRFCDLGDGNYIGLRRKSDEQWEAIWASCEHTDPELLHPSDPVEERSGTFEPSFLQWLRRVHETDGWPWGEHIAMSDDRPPLLRVW
jgi:hypothetical protein